MRNQVITTIIIALLLTTTLGLATMNHMDQDHSSCPFEVPGVANCAQLQSPFGFLTSHLDAFSRFTSAIPAINSLVAFLLLLSSLIFLIPVIFAKNFDLFNFQIDYTHNRLRESFVSLKRSLLIDWLALHMNSPTIILGR